MLDGIEPGALCEHPAGEDPLLLALEHHLVDLDEGGRLRLLGGRPRVAGPRRDLEGAERRRLVQRHFQARDLGGHLVEGREHGDGVVDALRHGRGREQRQPGDGQRQAPRETRRFKMQQSPGRFGAHLEAVMDRLRLRR